MGNPAVPTYGSYTNLGSGWTLSAAGDLNGGVRDDLVFQNTFGATAIWLLGNSGTSVAGCANLPDPISSWRLV